jgi:hypothetical protein
MKKLVRLGSSLERSPYPRSSQLTDSCSYSSGVLDLRFSNLYNPGRHCLLQILR